jgi:hypothetical protein
VGDHVRIEFVPERPGDFGGKDVDADEAHRDLSWKPVVDFEAWGVSLRENGGAGLPTPGAELRAGESPGHSRSLPRTLPRRR